MLEFGGLWVPKGLSLSLSLSPLDLLLYFMGSPYRNLTH